MLMAVAVSSATTDALRSTVWTGLLRRSSTTKLRLTRLCQPRTSFVTVRNWLSRSAPCRELKHMAASIMASTSRSPATSAREAAQWLYFGYLAGE